MMMNSGELRIVEKIYKIAKERYFESGISNHPCEHPIRDGDWGDVKMLAETLIDINKED